jgi:F0F1-type ATP synthase assembly protein I
MEIIAVIFFSAIVSGVLTGYVADAKGYSMLGWFLVGCAVPLLGLIAAAGMPLKSDSLNAEAERRRRLSGADRYVAEVESITKRQQ